MPRPADLNVICKHCGSEVSPYVTECPYCGQRVRKRAPKIERPGGARRPPRAGARAPRRPRAAVPGLRLGRLRSGEIPGLRPDPLAAPWATILLVAASFVIYLVAVAGGLDPARIIVAGKLGGEWWRVFTAPFVHISGGTMIFAGGAYQFATMIAVGVFGWLLERRHGPWAVLALYVLAGAGGMLVAAAVEPDPLAFGGNSLGLGLLCAWAVPDLLAWRRGHGWEGDLLGTATIAVVLLLMPAVVDGVSWVAGFAGAVIGLVVGLPLARLRLGLGPPRLG